MIARGRFFVGQRVAMRRRTKTLLDQKKFPLTLAGGLRKMFADFASTQLPRRLAELMHRLSADRDERSGDEPDHGARDERSGDEPNHGASATEMPSHIDRRGRR
jgi:hypothetical protein